ncbi:MAG: hypothetical protein LBI82_10360 [Dysgonamonadaceae bacterium]|jgi:hypothetical protein|nr:hypothetical protein [Dysgonamonadaceae bacterium]
MKSVRFTLISLALFVGFSVYACWSPTYTPGEYYVFYSYPVESTNEAKVDDNIQDWQKLTGNKVSLIDIDVVVYSYPIADLEKIFLKKGTDTNTFVNYLRKKKDKEIVNYLLLAKRCEIARAKRNERWWYPTKDDLKYVDLQEIVQEALAYKGSRLKIRYLLQAVRAAYAMKDYDLCLDLWEKQIKNLPRSAVKTMCQSYIGGIWFQRGDYEKAITFYNEGNDQSSFWWCAQNMTKENTDLERIKILYKYQPSAKELAKMLQDICRSAEKLANLKVFDNKTEEEISEMYYYELDGKTFRQDRKRFMAVRDFALQVAAENRSNNPAMWQYAAAFLTFLDGKTSLAMQYAEKAADLNGTSFIKEKVKVLQIMLYAYAAKNYDEDFENSIFPQLQWLDSLICRDINVKSCPEGYYDSYAKSIKEEYSDWYTKNNYSQYYPFDMMRKITLSVMLPKYRQQKDYTKALLLAGMASECLRSLVDFRRIEKWGTETYHTDYSTDIFNYMNEFPVENVIEYQQLLQSGGRDEFERFLASKCYKNNNYLNELIGTKYLRLEKFDKAISYLSKVSDKYIESMNIYYYFQLDPFREVYKNKEYQEQYPTYKLNFAKKMLSLQQKMQSEKNKEKNAAATWQYAIALSRSVSDGESWALTTYYIGSYNDYENTWENLLRKRSEKLVAQAIKTMQGSESHLAVRAKYDWYENVEYSNDESYGKFVKNYKTTDIFEDYLSECDKLNSYYLNSYIPQYLKEKWKYD